MSKPSRLRRVFGAIWNGITRVRLALSNILFLAFLALIYFVVTVTLSFLASGLERRLRREDR